MAKTLFFFSFYVILLNGKKLNAFFWLLIRSFNEFDLRLLSVSDKRKKKFKSFEKMSFVKSLPKKIQILST